MGGMPEAADVQGSGPVDVVAVGTISLALFAALLFAVSAALQQGAARQAATEAGQGRFLVIVGIARRLVTDRRWLAGQGANVAGFVVHAVALRVGGGGGGEGGSFTHLAAPAEGLGGVLVVAGCFKKKKRWRTAGGGAEV